MKKHIALITLLSVLLALSLCACGTSNAPIDNGGNGDNTNTSGTNGSAEFSQMVFDALDYDISDLRYEYEQLKGAAIPCVISAEQKYENEIVFGDTARDITTAAKAALESELSSGEYDSGYIIYCKDGSVAVYWTLTDMSSIAIADFIDTCIISKQLVLDEGIISSKLYDKRKFEEDKYWLALEAVAEPDVVAALKKIHAYYNGSRIVEWLANLYDPETGGIYYSRSARDNYPFLPDIESTAQAINFLLNNNAISNRNILPNDLKIKFIEFARNLQSPTDGYFYHPQWPQSKDELANDRYGRDIGWSTTTITSFLADYDGDGTSDPQYPFYCAPNGVKCALHNGTSETCSFPQSVAYYTSAIESNATVALSTNRGYAVSKLTSSVVTPTATVSSKPDYSSKEAFSAWLEAYNETIKEDSGRAHQIAALCGEIKAHGYIDVVLDHLDRVQEEVYNEQIANGEEPTGLWQRNVDYNAVWGLLKYMSFYNESGYQRKIDIKYVPHIVKTCIKVIEMPPDGDYASNDLYNQWSGISNLIKNVDRFYGTSGVRQIYELMQQNTASLIENSLLKIEPFRQEDGSFSSNSDGTTGPNIYSTHIALGVAEGNVNSTGLICSMYRCIYSCLGLPLVPLCNSDDGQLFIDTLLNAEPIIKNELRSGPIDFEDGNIPSDVELTLNNKDIGAEVSIASDPLDITNNVLYFQSITGTTKGDSILFTTTGTGTSCYVYEVDFYVSSDSDDKIVLQSKMHGSYMIMFTKSGETVKITDNATTNGTGKKYTNLAEVSTDEWFTVRIEYYLNGETQNQLEAPKIKFYLNGEYVCTSDNFYGSHNTDAVPKNTYDEVSFLSPKAATSYMFIDNCLFEAVDKLYVEESN